MVACQSLAVARNPVFSSKVKDEHVGWIKGAYMQMHLFQRTSLCFLCLSISVSFQFLTRELIQSGGEGEAELAVTDA